MKIVFNEYPDLQLDKTVIIGESEDRPPVGGSYGSGDMAARAHAIGQIRATLAALLRNPDVPRTDFDEDDATRVEIDGKAIKDRYGLE